MRILRIQSEIFDPANALARLSQLGGGGVASFTGIARQDGDVTAIELEHYPAMTEAVLADLLDTAEARWDLLGSVLIHRIGIIAVGEAVVFVGTASAHRAAALQAAAFLIDRLKTDAPFWKKEHRGDGSAEWVEAKASDMAAADHWR
jgi:molybdopterin synthase catalytic subunit